MSDDLDDYEPPWWANTDAPEYDPAQEFNEDTIASLRHGLRVGAIKPEFVELALHKALNAIEELQKGSTDAALRALIRQWAYDGGLHGFPENKWDLVFANDTAILKRIVKWCGERGVELELDDARRLLIEVNEEFGYE